MLLLNLNTGGLGTEANLPQLINLLILQILHEVLFNLHKFWQVYKTEV